MASVWTLLKRLLLPLMVGFLSSLLVGDSTSLYSHLLLPPLSPPPWVFPLVWTILYLLMGLSAHLIAEADAENKGLAYRLYALQLGLNFLWPLLFFKWELPLAAFLCLLLLIGVVLGMIWQFATIDPRAARLQLPYLLWLLFAGYLNFAIFLLNL